MKFAIVVLLFLAIAVCMVSATSEIDNAIDAILDDVLSDDMGESMASTCSVTASSLNLRSSPSTSSGKVASMPRGSSLTLLSSSTYSGSGYKWKYVRYGSRTGYAATNFISCSSSGGGGSSSGCQLMKYSNSVFQGKTVIAHKGWKSSLDRIASHARACGVKIYITSSYRSNANVNGAIVKPASRSNHMVGQAIDMNVVAKEGFCNSSCLRNPRGSTKCFIDKIRSDSGLRWGGDFSTPDTVHIDSGLNVKSSSQWDSLYQQTQQSYKSRCY